MAEPLRIALAGLGTVGVGDVEERDARVERRVDDGVGARLALGGGAGAAEVVAPEPDDGDDQSRVTQSAVAHVCHGNDITTVRRRCAGDAGPRPVGRRDRRLAYEAHVVMQRMDLVLRKRVAPRLGMHARMVQYLIYVVCAVRLPLDHVVLTVRGGTDLQPSFQRQR